MVTRIKIAYIFKEQIALTNKSCLLQSILFKYIEINKILYWIAIEIVYFQNEQMKKRILKALGLFESSSSLVIYFSFKYIF